MIYKTLDRLSPQACQCHQQCANSNSLCTVLSSIIQLSVTYYRINMWASVTTKVHACMSCLINQLIVQHCIMTLHKKGKKQLWKKFPFSILGACNLQGKMTNSNWQRRRAVSCPYILNRGRPVQSRGFQAREGGVPARPVLSACALGRTIPIKKIE